MLTERFKEYLDQAEVIKTLNADLKDANMSNEIYPELEEITKQMKELRGKLSVVSEIALIKEKRDEAKERLDLLKDLLLAEMAEEGKTEVEYEGKKAKIISAMKFEK